MEAANPLWARECVSSDSGQCLSYFCVPVYCAVLKIYLHSAGILGFVKIGFGYNPDQECKCQAGNSSLKP